MTLRTEAGDSDIGRMPADVARADRLAGLEIANRRSAGRSRASGGRGSAAPSRLASAGAADAAGRRGVWLMAPVHPRSSLSVGFCRDFKQGFTLGERRRLTSGSWTTPYSRGPAAVEAGAATTCVPCSLERGVAKHAEGSCLVRFGDTQVLCTASLDEHVPPWLRGGGKGWVTAEYGMLPRATTERTRREASAGKQSAAPWRSSA